MRKIFLEDLPKYKGKIDWKNSMNLYVKFIYEDIEGEVKILDYISCKGNGKIKIGYKNEIMIISIPSFKECSLGKILNVVTGEFKIEIGTRFQDDKRDITIIDRNKIQDEKTGQWCKYYKYHCNKCTFDGGKHYSIRDGEYKEDLWILESSLLNLGTGCACCNGNQIVVKGINDIKTLRPDLEKYFVNKEDMYKYLLKSNKKVKCVCPQCGDVREIYLIYLVMYGFSCQKCSDGISYPNKFMFNMLQQLNIKFDREIKFDWCKYEKYRDSTKTTIGIYDFVLKECKIIIEMDGGWHYKDNIISSETKEEIEYRDHMKDILALRNGYRVIRIPCNYNGLDRFGYIKNNIENKLNILFNLSVIDWDKCDIFAVKNIVEEVCNYWNINGENYIVEDIANNFGISVQTAYNYLKQGKRLKWCDYNSKIEENRTKIKNGTSNGKSVEIFKDNISLGIFISVSELERESERLFGIRLTKSRIIDVCKGKYQIYKTYTFKYIEEVS